jgi:hypothetical protein
MDENNDLCTFILDISLMKKMIIDRYKIKKCSILKMGLTPIDLVGMVLHFS